IVAGPRLPTAPPGRPARPWGWFVPSWAPTVVPWTTCPVRRSAASTKAPPSDHSRRTRPRRPRSASSPSAHQGSSVGGCAGSVGRRHSSTIIRTLRSACRAYSRRASAPPFWAAGKRISRRRPGDGSKACETRRVAGSTRVKMLRDHVRRDPDRCRPPPSYPSCCDQLREPLARVEGARLHRGLVDADDLGDLLDRFAVVVGEVDDLAVLRR